MTDHTAPLVPLAIGALLALVVAIVIDESVASVTLLRTVLALTVVGVVPGALGVTLLGMEPRVSARWIVYVVATSLLVVMAVGLVLNLVVPPLGYATPIDAWPMLTGVAVVTVAAAALQARRDAGTGWTRLAVDVDLDRPVVPAALALVPLVVLVVTLLNETGRNGPLLLVLGAIALAPLAVSLVDGLDRALPWLLWCLALSLLLHASLWRGYVFGGHASIVYVWLTGAFSPAQVQLLPNAIIWPVTARLAGVDITTQLHVLNQPFVALVPVAMFVAFRRYVGSRRAFLGASVFVVAHPFYYLYPDAGRVATPVFFLATFAAVIADDSLSVLRKRALSIVAAFGVIVSHYGTSYYVMYAVVASVGILAGLRLVDEGVAWGRGGIADGGTRSSRAIRAVRNPFDPDGVLDWPFVGLYLVAVIAWYMYTGGGRRFTALVDHVHRTYVSLMTPGTRGSTATRLAVDYGTVSIRIAKVLYAVVGLCIALGLLVTWIDRLRPDGETAVDDEYLALASAVLVLFAGTFVVRNQWGGGRPMMIVFAVTAVFGVLGVEALGRGLAKTYRERSGHDLGSTHERLRTLADALPAGWTPRWHLAFAALLAVMLLVNAGVAAVAIGGFAPSNVPRQAALAESPSPNHHSRLYVDEDVRTHAWLAVHRDPSLSIYGDRLARAQATDRYNAEIAAVSGGPLYRFRRRNHLHRALPGLEPGYVVLVGHNVAHGTIAINYLQWEPLSEYDLDRAERAKVYANDHGAIYYSDEAT